MCVRCGTGKIAWCTDPDRHGDIKPPPAPDAMSPHSALRLIERVITQARSSDAEALREEGLNGRIDKALDTLWDLVVLGGSK